jgi:hypothetical protein
LAVISITIIGSAQETIPGIPDIVSLSTNIPATIFYTLNGVAPDTYSPIYISPILIPGGKLHITLTIFATNGIDNSAVITQEYVGDAAAIPAENNEKIAHSAIVGLDNTGSANSLFPFGAANPLPSVQYLNPSNAGTTVYNTSLPATSIGFDANQNPDGYTNQPYQNYEFKQIYSQTNYLGQVLPGIGNLPAPITIIGKTTPVEYSPEVSSFSDKLFNPKALVIYQDTTTEDPTNPVHIGRMDFSLENPEIVKDGVLLFNSALDSPTTTGSFLKTHYNPRTNMLTSYSYDSSVNRWIISSTPFQPTNKDVGALYQMAVDNRQPGSGKVFQWQLFSRRTLI